MIARLTAIVAFVFHRLLPPAPSPPGEDDAMLSEETVVGTFMGILAQNALRLIGHRFAGLPSARQVCPVAKAR